MSSSTTAITMPLSLNIVCFAASYVTALALEVAGFWLRFRWQRAAVLLSTAAGLVAHTWYLAQRAAETPAAPLASHHDWFVVAAWAVAMLYLAGLLYYPRSSLGVFLLPVVLALVGVSAVADVAPLATSEAPRIWGRLHGICLMLGTVAVLLGFVSGLMYLLQSGRLKRKLAQFDALPLPSLERLERVNSWSLGIAAMLVGGGFLTGVLTQMARQGDGNKIPWADPVVLSLGAMLLWLVVAELFRLVYPAARRGRKVAYLTMAALAFLVLVLVSITLDDTLHLRGDSATTPVQGGST